jgi:hypothetical protein
MSKWWDNLPLATRLKVNAMSMEDKIIWYDNLSIEERTAWATSPPTDSDPFFRAKKMEKGHGK